MSKYYEKQKKSIPAVKCTRSSWSPGAPFDQPDPVRALERHAAVWGAQSNVRRFPLRPYPTSPAGEKRRAA